MLFKYIAVAIDPRRISSTFESEITSAAQLMGGTEIEFCAADDVARKPAVSFLVEAPTERAALTLGHEAMRSVVGGDFGEGVMSQYPAAVD
jgi:hypothetical protein